MAMETSNFNPPRTQCSSNKQDRTRSLLQNPRVITTEAMGRPFHEPSPTREAYISSSKTSSPSSATTAYDTKMGELSEPGQRIETLDHSFTLTGGSASHNQKQMAILSHHLQGAGEDTCRQQNDYDQQAEKLNTFSMRDEVEETNEVGTPRTPTKKHVPISWHGLLSPQTPGLAKHSPKANDTYLSDDSAKSSASEVLSNSAVGETPLQDVFASVKQYPGKDAKHATPEQTEITVAGLRQTPRNPCSSLSDADASGGKDKNGDDFKATENDVEHDAILARQLGEITSLAGIRRSARLRRKSQQLDITQPAVPAPRRMCKRPMVEDSSAQPGLTIIPCKSEPVPFKGLPTVHSVDWQLQYPPGGSTHPSYPYPSLDPRLIFHQPFVPVVDGLPDITRVPKLLLPINWKHVSWSGLLPIVFDPYHQAFKLTPVGPLPLTCEELHQTGLHRYVPGGELHPEYGMLPDMLKLSDGSDAEVFNFDGVDWTLPWEGQLDFHAPSASSLASPSTPNAFNLETTCPWREARDCPNMVIDLADAWRWLSVKEADPTLDFIPTPGKTRRGTGAIRYFRKLKSPIPELMMLALQAEEPASPSLISTPNPALANQDAPTSGRTTRLFCPFKSVATPASVDITLLGATEFTIIELLCYFPQHYYWMHCVDRLSRADVLASFVRNIIFMTRALNEETGPKLSTISSAFCNARKRNVTEHEVIERGGNIEVSMGTPPRAPNTLLKLEADEGPASYTAQGWTYDFYEKIDYPLLALAHGLQSLPLGVDAGPLTALILWCRENGYYRVLLSDVPAMLKEAGINPLIERGTGGCPDKEVTGRYAEVLRKERLKAKIRKGAGKRATEESGEGCAKRMKAE